MACPAVHWRNPAKFLKDAPRPDWPGTVCALLDAGASTSGMVLSADDPKSPSPEVADLLRARGIPGEASTMTGD